MKATALITSFLVLLGNTLCGLIVWESMKPYKGANIHLMALPLVAPVVGLLALVAIHCTLQAVRQTPLRRTLLSLNVVSFAWFFVLFVLG